MTFIEMAIPNSTYDILIEGLEDALQTTDKASKNPDLGYAYSVGYLSSTIQHTIETLKSLREIQ
jgi:hypothetical protein